MEFIESLIQLSLGGLGLLTAIEGLFIWKKSIVGTNNIDFGKKIIGNLLRYKNSVKSITNNHHYMVHISDINEKIIQFLENDRKEKWVEIDKFENDIKVDLKLAPFVWENDFEEINYNFYNLFKIVNDLRKQHFEYIYHKSHILENSEKEHDQRSKRLLKKQFDRYQKYNKDCKLKNNKDGLLIEHNILFSLSKQEDGYNNKLESKISDIEKYLYKKSESELENNLPFLLTLFRNPLQTLKKSIVFKHKV